MSEIQPDYARTHNYSDADRRALLTSLLKDFQKSCYATSVSKGWYDQDKKYPHITSMLRGGRLNEEETRELNKLLERNKGEAIALIHSELSEALENLRDGCTPDDKIPNFKGIEAELADVFIRIFDIAEHFKYDVVGAMMAKAEMNKGRPYLHGGRTF